MFKIAILSLVFIALTDWILVEDKKSGFNILFPSEVNTKSDSLDSGIGMTYTKTMSASLGEGLQAKIFLANYTQYPNYIDMEDKDSTGYYICQTIIEQVQDQLQEAKLIYNTSTTINGMQTQMASLRYGSDSSIVRMALVMHKNSLMSLQYYAPYETGMSRDVEKFFNSYNRIDRK